MVKYEYVEFTVDEETWNSYKLADGTIFKTKYVLANVLKLLEPDETGNVGYNFKSENVNAAIVPEELRGPPDRRKYSGMELNNSMDEEDIDFEIIKESWNQYTFSDGTILKVKLTMTTASRTEKYDVSGERLYIVNNQPLIKPKISKAVRRQFREIMEKSR